MEIPEKQLAEFKAIYKEEFGKELSDYDATVASQNLLNFMQIILQPLPKDVELPEPKDGQNLISYLAVQHLKYGDIQTQRGLLTYIGENWTLKDRKLEGDLHEYFFASEKEDVGLSISN